MIDWLHDCYFAAVAGDSPTFEAWPTNQGERHPLSDYSQEKLMGVDGRLPSARVSVGAVGLPSWRDGGFGEAIRDV